MIFTEQGAVELIKQNREYLYILLLSLCRFEPIVSKLCSTNSHKMYKYS